MDTTVITNIWRPLYDELVVGFRLLTPEWSKLKRLKNFRQMSLRSINWPVDLFYGGGIAITYDGGSTARAQSNSPVEATDSWLHMAGRFEVSYDAFTMNNDAKVTRQQIKKQLSYQVRDKLRAFQKRMSVMFYGKNDNVLCLVAGAEAAQTVIELDDLYGVTGLTFTASDLFRAGKDYVAFLDTSNSDAIIDICKVTAVDDSTTAITVTPAVTLADGDKVVLANHLSNATADTDHDGTAGGNTVGFNGLLSLATDTTVHNISGTTYPEWTASTNASLGAALSGAKLYKAFELAEKESGYRPDVALTTIGAIAAGGGSELDQRRYMAKDDTMRLGFKTLNVMGVPVEGMLFCPAGNFFAYSSRALRKLAPDEDVKTVKTGGPNDFEFYGSQLGYYKDHVFRAQLTAISRKAIVRYYGVTES